MSSSRSAEPTADALAVRLRDAPFVRVVARADGAALAAGGLLARALGETGVPFQMRVRPDPGTEAPADDGLVAVVGASGGDVSVVDSPAAQAYETARELGAAPDPTLALAGVVADGGVPGRDDGGALDAATERGLVTRRPGVAVPTADLADGIAHTTLVHAPVSGDVETARAALAELDLPAELDEDAHRRVASVVAIEAATTDGATPRAAEAVERALRPHATPEGPFATVGGHADVLAAAAREHPGVGVGVALGHDSRTAALDAWREHARSAHRALRTAAAERHSGVFVVRAEAPVAALGTVARLARDFRSPEPVALAVGDEGAAAVAVDAAGVSEALVAAAEAVDGTAYGDERRGEARFEDGETESFVTAFREAL